MVEVRRYLISVTAAALLCSVIHLFFENHRTNRAMIRLLTGIFMAITVISPLLKLDLSNIDLSFEDASTMIEATMTENDTLVENEFRESIKQSTAAYIGDKATSLGLDLTIEVSLDTEQYMPVPTEVTLSGQVSPYAKKVLSMFIEKELGIPMERQLWF